MREGGRKRKLDLKGGGPSKTARMREDVRSPSFQNYRIIYIIQYNPRPMFMKFNVSLLKKQNPIFIVDHVKINSHLQRRQKIIIKRKLSTLEYRQFFRGASRMIARILQYVENPSAAFQRRDLIKFIAMTERIMAGSILMAIYTNLMDSIKEDFYPLSLWLKV